MNVKPAKIITLLTGFCALWLAVPRSVAQLTNTLGDLSVTNGVMLSYRTLDALKFTPNGRLAMIYWIADGSNLDLTYNEEQTNGAWVETVVATVDYLHTYYDNTFQDYQVYPFPPFGLHFYFDYAPPSALLFDSQGNPHVIYADFASQQLVHCARTISGWEDLGEIAISMANADDCFAAAIGPGDVIHVIAGGDTNVWLGYSYTYTPVHYCWVNSAWQDQTASEGSMYSVSPGDYSVQLDYEPRPFAMVVDSSNSLHVVYTPMNVDVANGNGTSSSFSQLAYMSNKSGKWANEIIYNPPDGHSDAGLGASINIGPNGGLAVASFYDPRVQTGSSTGGSLFLSLRRTNGVWTTTTVANSAQGYIAGDGNTGTGFAPQLLFDYAGRPHILFTDHASEHFNGAQDEYCGNVRHAWLDNGAWQIETVFSQAAPINNQCFFPNLAMSRKQVAMLAMVSQDEPYIAITNQPFGNILFYLAFTNFVPAGYVDTNGPILKVTTPVAKQNVSNAVFTASGTAADNVGVAGVYYQLNNNAWTTATTLNEWTNWTAAGLSLTPGTNVLRIYATDVNENISATNTVSFTFVATAPLAVSTNGSGTITPNLNGKPLEIGRTYAMTAKASTGFGFVNWTGSTVTNSSRLTFVMASNLTFTANFKDISRPVNVIVSPLNNHTVTNAIVVATGNAKDNVGVTAVWYRVNSGAWQAADLTGGTNWLTPNLSPSLVAGPNTLSAYALDAADNTSLTNTVRFQYAVP